jgi:hypothetical protein
MRGHNFIPICNDLAFIVNRTRIPTIAVDALLLSPAAADRLLSDTNLQDRKILSPCVCRIAVISRVQLMEFRVILGHIQEINFHRLTRKHCGECSGVVR